ncbi:MAG TPA: hypothetical protein VGR03_06240 [Candidatus Acidoferrum sp.]|nr:hypothetical protein [Candidatus Acidoferrum sp.]
MIAAPILFLVVDFCRIPVLLSGCQGGKEEITLRTLVEKQTALLGSYLGHRFYVSLDAIQDSQYLHFLKTAPTALVIGIDHDKPSEPSWGGLTRAVLRKFDEISLEDAAMLRSVVLGSDPVSGHLLAKPLGIPSARFGGFPVNFLYIVGIKSRGDGSGPAKKQQADTLKSGLQDVMAQAKRDKIENLILPCVSVDPRDPATLQYHEYFPLVFIVSEPAWRPNSIYLSLYQDWDDTSRSAALRALQTSWTETCANAGKQSLFVREVLRLMLLTLVVCLVVSSLYVAISVKNFLIISCSFVALGSGALALLSPFVENWNSSARFGAHVTLLVALAVLFPLLPRFNPKEIFGKR